MISYYPPILLLLTWSAAYRRIGYGTSGVEQTLLHPRLTVDGARGENAESGEKHTRDREASGDLERNDGPELVNIRLRL